MSYSDSPGFTLMEMAIVLVVIGLITGGIVVGQDLIRAAAERSQIAQIQSYQSAVNTFLNKYQALPGDMAASTAATYGFAARGQYEGQGDGNGVLEGNLNNSSSGAGGLVEVAGETVMFWVDLSQAQLIDQQFTTASPTAINSGNIAASLFPQGVIKSGTYIFAHSGNMIAFPNAGGSSGYDTNNYLSLGVVTNVGGSFGTLTEKSGSLSVKSAYAIDLKIDDGNPVTGTVTATYATSASTMNWDGHWDGSAISGSSSTCYDNGGVTNGPQRYSTEINNGGGGNCALTFMLK